MASKKAFEEANESTLEASNPFSFTKFVREREKKPENKKRKGINKINQDESIDNSNSPDISTSSGGRGRGNLFGDTLEDSFSFDTEVTNDEQEDDLSSHGNPFSIKSFVKTKDKKKTANSRILKIVNDDLQEIKDGKDKVHDLTWSDSDGDEHEKSDDSSCVSPLSAAYVLPTTTLTGSETNLLQSDLYELEHENQQLKEEIAQLKIEMRDERLASKKRIEDLFSEVEYTRRKEADETASLERVVQMVEENLEKTTRRAVKAENNVARLKEEIKLLKENTVSRALYDTIVEEYEHTLASVREKSQGAAESMRKAASTAEPSLRSILDGLASLRLIAEQFDDIDRITEISQKKSSTN